MTGWPVTAPVPAASDPVVAMETATEVRAADLKAPTKVQDARSAKDPNSPSDKVRRSAQRTIEGAKYGVSPADTR